MNNFAAPYMSGYSSHGEWGSQAPSTSVPTHHSSQQHGHQEAFSASLPHRTASNTGSSQFESDPLTPPSLVGVDGQGEATARASPDVPSIQAHGKRLRQALGDIYCTLLSLNSATDLSLALGPVNRDLEIFGIEIAPAGSTARTAYLEDSLRMSEQRTAELLDKAGREMSERLTSCGHAMRNSEERAASYGRRLATSQAANAQLEDHVELLERQNLVLEEYLRLSRERDALDTVDRISKHRQNLIPHIVEGTIGLDGPWDESGYHVASNKTTTQPQTNTRAGYQDSRVSTRPYGGEGEH